VAKLIHTGVLCIYLALCSCGCNGTKPATDSQPLTVFRMANKADLDFTIRDITPGPAGFPSVVTDLRNQTDDDILTTYAPGSVTIHCGPYTQTGPAGTYGQRREILDSHGFIDFLPITGGWSNDPQNSSDLMMPAQLPPGTYDIWATFMVVGSQPQLLQTRHESYTVKSR
jgi:hypothetical protein